MENEILLTPCTAEDFAPFTNADLLPIADADWERVAITDEDFQRWAITDEDWKRLTPSDAELEAMFQLSTPDDQLPQPKKQQPRPRRKDLTGQRFGKWSVLAFAGLDKARRALWSVRCGCGSESTVTGSDLTSEHSTQCKLCSGVGVTTHGHTMGKLVSPLYKTWRSMKERCYNPRHKSYRHYGGRGITIWPQWRDSFIAFATYVLNTIGSRPAGRSLDRIDNGKGYIPGNLRWATQSEQCQNRRKAERKQAEKQAA